ncbi:MAG: hypothetical protein O3A46_00935, partial [Candidatus Poribacteria bacterium]|nr:hypothetical protein [Candidatus Poribacteria bacterium]
MIWALGIVGSVLAAPPLGENATVESVAWAFRIEPNRDDGWKRVSGSETELRPGGRLWLAVDGDLPVRVSIDGRGAKAAVETYRIDAAFGDS